MTICVEKLTIKIDKTEFVLSLEDARTLYEELQKIFGEKTYFPYYVPNTIPSYPAYPDPFKPWITCNTETN
jgi:hypothetical protein